MQNETIERLLRGAYDLHMHAAPSPFNRVMDDYGLLQEADAAGMAGIMLKSHYESTAARAELVNTHTKCKATAFGGIVLNWPVGGLNPYAVANALKRGCKIVWMPTRDAKNSLFSGDMPGDFFERSGLTIFEEDGSLKPIVYEIFDVVKKYDGTLATGHLSPEESLILCREGCAHGIRMVLTHPEFTRTVVPADVQRELANLGVYIEHCWYNIGGKECTPETMAANIRAAGINHCYLCTDRGQAEQEHPVEGMKLFLKTMLDQGFTEEELRIMTHDVPRKVLNLT